MSALPLFTPKAGGGWHMPTVEIVPGVFVEQCGFGERIADLEPNELEHLGRAWRGWNRVGYETGREIGAVSFRADLRDGDVMLPRNWYIGRRGERVRLDCTFPETLREERALHLRPWAVEFSKPDRGDGKPGFVRRRFWFASRHRVPTIVVRSREERNLQRDRRVLGRLVLLLVEQRHRAAARAA